MIQFGIAMAGSFAAAYFALQQPEVGGLSGLLSRLDPATIRLLPDFSDWSLALPVLILPLTVQWWSAWYPGAEPGGGSYIAQRMLAARTERDAMAGTLFFNVAHYALRSWPWILVALSSLLVYPQLTDIAASFPHVDPALIGHDMAYPAMLKFLPVGWLGLMVAGLLAAYVSTMSTHLNWGTSYLVHDLYRRFFRPDATERHYVAVGRVVTALLMVAAAAVTYILDSARESFQLLISIGAGTGLLYLLRWFWWRINAWSEVAAMVSSFLLAAGFLVAQKNGAATDATTQLLVSVGITTLVWIGVTLVTAPTDRGTLVAFFRLVRPAGPGWAPVQAEAGVGGSPDSLPMALLGWVLGCTAVYSALFGAGSFLFGNTGLGTALTAAFAISSWSLARLLRAMWAGEGRAG